MAAKLSIVVRKAWLVLKNRGSSDGGLHSDPSVFTTYPNGYVWPTDVARVCRSSMFGRTIADFPRDLFVFFFVHCC